MPDKFLLLRKAKQEIDQKVATKFREFLHRAEELDLKAGSPEEKEIFYEEVLLHIKELGTTEKRILHILDKRYNYSTKEIKGIIQALHKVKPEFSKLKHIAHQQTKIREQKELEELEEIEHHHLEIVHKLLNPYIAQQKDEALKDKEQVLLTSWSNIINSTKLFSRIASFLVMAMVSTSIHSIVDAEKIILDDGRVIDKLTPRDLSSFISFDKNLTPEIGPHLPNRESEEYVAMQKLVKTVDSMFVETNKHNGYFTYGLRPNTTNPKILRQIDKLARKAMVENKTPAMHITSRIANPQNTAEMIPRPPPGYHFEKTFTARTKVTAYTPIGSGLQAKNDKHVEDGYTATMRNGFISDGVAAAIGKRIQGLKLKKGMVVYIDAKDINGKIIGFKIIDDNGGDMHLSAQSNILHLDVRGNNLSNAKKEGVKENVRIYVYSSSLSTRNHLSKRKDRLF